MIEFLTSRDDVIAVRASGKLSAADLESLIIRIEDSLKLRPKTHMFVEVTDFGGLAFDDLGDHMRRGLAMLGRLERFGRVAVVSDQTWLRWPARIESALLPKISYRTFTLAERKQALTWVESGRMPGAARVIETDKPTVCGFVLDGFVSKDDLEALTDYFENVLEREGKLRVLARIRRLDGIALSGLVDDDFFDMKRDMLRRVERYALVGGPAWLATWAQGLNQVLPMEIRHFAADDEPAAWGWLEAAPRLESVLTTSREA